MILKFRSSISLKITCMVLAGSLLIFAVVLAYSYNYSRKLILAEAEKNARNLTLALANRIEQEFRAAEKEPANLACFLETGSCDRETLNRLLSRLVTENPEIYGSGVAFEPYEFDHQSYFYCPYCHRSKDGIAFAQLGSASYDYFRYDWYSIPKSLSAPVWSEPYFDEGGADILMATYSYPLYEPFSGQGRERLRGVITADISLDWLTKLLCSISVARSGYCFLISGNGTFVSHPRRDFIMRESVFSIAEQMSHERLRTVGRNMIRRDSGFEDIGTSLMGKDSFVAYARIPSTGWALGAVFPRDELFVALAGLHAEKLTLALIGIGLLMVVSHLVARSIARPLRSMAAAADKVANGNLDVNLSHIRSVDEVGRLAEAFVRMTNGLKERDFIKDTFGRYLTKEVAKRLLESKDGLRLGGEEREISILMSDLRGFTALTSNMPPEQVISFLNRYLGRMVEILIDYRGIIDEIMGDGILAFFGAPEPLEDHPARAVACALKMQLAMDEISSQNEAEGLPHLEMGTAVNTGLVVVGNIGSEKRTKYGAVGSQVNFTGRVESYSVGGQVLISQATHDKIRDILDVRDVLHVQMKGVPGDVALYDVRGIRGDYNVQLPDREETPIALPVPIRARIRRIARKTVSQSQITAVITHVSRTSAVIVPDAPISIWEDLKLELIERSTEVIPGEIYAKAVSVDGDEVTIRFTSVSAETYKVFRRVVHAE
ncbi:MAG: HAMP domain-containing protein [Desulfomonile tiedjei]|uniref:HAMP domain-containing protein n=1 Tax=Desulfomonile tiedjei TaxID=2358 RepID=A0A9D6Z3I5_9BACT|nr:HAMP domain-containing protein [Desulfomonile tiedjei]